MRSINRGVIGLVAVAALAGLGGGGAGGGGAPRASGPDNLRLWKRRRGDGKLTRSNGILTDDQVKAMAEHEARCIKGGKNKRRRRKGYAK